MNKVKQSHHLKMGAFKKKMQDEYTQTEVIHCPNKDCKGMLLTNPFKHELKCSDCHKYYLLFTEYKEVSLLSSHD